MPGDVGKPRPTLVVQNDIFNRDHATITLVLITSDVDDHSPVRIAVDPTPGNGLRVPSQIMVDKVVTHLRSKLGRVSDEWMTRRWRGSTRRSRSGSICRDRNERGL
jgi:mRNA interferase MazF